MFRRTRRQRVAGWIIMVILISALPLGAWCLTLPFFKGGGGALFGEMLLVLTALFQFLLAATGSLEVAWVSLKRLDNGVDSLALATGSARCTCLTVLIPSFASRAYLLLWLLPFYALAVAYDGLSWGGLLYLLAVVYAVLTASCCLGLLGPALDYQKRKAAGVFLGVGFWALAITLYHIASRGASFPQTMAILTKGVLQYWSFAVIAAAFVAVIAFECAAQHVRRTVRGETLGAPRTRRLRVRRRHPVMGADPIRQILNATLGLRPVSSACVAARAFLGAGFAVGALVPPVGFAAANWFVRFRTTGRLKYLSERGILDDLLLTPTEDTHFARVLFSVVLRPNLMVLPALALATVAGSACLFVVFLFIHWLSSGAFLESAPERIVFSSSKLMSAANMGSLGIIMALSGLAVALADIFFITAATCEKHLQGRGDDYVKKLLGSRVELALGGGVLLGIAALAFLRFAVYQNVPAMGLGQMILSHILFCLCLGLPMGIVGARSYGRLIRNFRTWLTTPTPEAPKQKALTQALPPF
ncbi:MAG TPA: hypothetical protein HPP77_00920 [Candidatus Hydrogenedentes bacterium]|nr:hypothetical protein [Candidatus Hydrogenedentota bacterium]